MLSLLAIVALYGMFGRAEAPVGNDAAPPTSESAQVKALLAEFPGSDEQSVLVVATRDDGGELTDADQTAITGLVPVVSEQTGHDARPRSSAKTARRPSFRCHSPCLPTPARPRTR